MLTNKALGKGLSALIPAREGFQANKESILNIPIANIKPNKHQPRLEFNKEKLEELMSSIKEKGVIQPVLVRKAGDGYELIAGERRLRAAATLGMETIPVIVKDVADLDMLEISLIENIQREDLNPMEEAAAFQKFITEFNFTQEKIAASLGKDRSTIANTIRLLGLPKKIQEYISKNSITAGHAKAILSLPTEIAQIRLADIIIKKGLSVRETEKAVARRKSGMSGAVIERDPDIAGLENKLRQFFGTRVKIFHGRSRGRIQIEYYSQEDLNRILGLLSAFKA
ncbi:MAG: ParB/RepB/Spo0J family partition protein [Candidatus Omnitrophota bacterium]|nr:ParB/RepB/Spo0J family partition protein [Candidatus Omnitrophota bacterium]